MSIVCHVLVHDSPKPFDRVQVRAVRGQLDKMDTTLWPCEKFSDIGRFVIGGIVPDDMDQSLVRVACFNLGETLCGTDTVDGRWPWMLTRPRAAVVGTAGFEPAFTQPYAGFV